MRTQNSIKNGGFAFAGQIISLAAGFAARTVFTALLGDDYLGLNGLFTSIIALLSFTELGLGTAVSFELYKPIADDDRPKIASLTRFYKTAYLVVAAVTFTAGMALLPFLGAVTRDVSSEVKNIPVIYLVFLANTVFSYFFSYKRAVITAYQKNYINTVYDSFFLLLQYAAQIAILVILRDYILYLVAHTVCMLLSDITLSLKADRMYPFIREKHPTPLGRETLNSLKKNITAMFFHRVGGIAVTGTDNLIIAQISVIILGYYTNYTYIVLTIAAILAQVFSSITASVGNLIAVESSDKQMETFDRLFFINFWMYGFFAVALSQTVQPFILLWQGQGRMLPEAVMYIMLINFYLNGMRQSGILAINAGGLFNQIKYKSFVEAIVNLAASLFLMLALDMGIYGVLLGTTVSILTTNFWWEPYTAFKELFGRSLRGYFIKYAKYTAVLLISWGATFFICSRISLGGWLGFIVTGAASVAVSNAVFAALLFREKEFGYVVSVAARFIKKTL